MLVTGIVVAPVACRSKPLRPAVGVLGVSLPRGGMDRAVRSGTGSRALRDLHDREGEQCPKDEANDQRTLTDPPLPSHAATLTTAAGQPTMCMPVKHNSHSIVTTVD